MPAHRTKDISGFTFGSLTVLAHCGRSSGNQLYKCRCDCGRLDSFYYCNLVTGRTRSCGCLTGSKIGARFLRHGESYTRGMTAEYKAWLGMKERCFNANGKNYRYYGARGITVCEQWKDSYSSFLEHIGRRPSTAHSVDRINNDGNYEPGNVRWATRKEQNNNTRRNKK